MKQILIYLMAWFSITNLNAQDKGQIEVRYGVVTFDLITEPGDFFKDRQGWGTQFDITYRKTKKISDRIRLIGGAGYTNFFYWDAFLFDLTPSMINIVDPEPVDIADNTSNSNYLNLKYGLEYSINQKGTSLVALFSHYLLIQPLQGRNQRRLFLNLDLGFDFKIGHKTQLKIYSPISIHPIVEDEVFQIILPGGNPPVNRFVEMNGLLLGIGYNLN